MYSSHLAKSVGAIALVASISATGQGTTMQVQLQPTGGGGTTSSGTYRISGSIQSFSSTSLPQSNSFSIAPAVLSASSTSVIDTDGDGVPDDQDAFPTDPAASVDTDGDGYPNAWNPGFSQTDSTIGLWLDKFPHDPTRNGWTDAQAIPVLTPWMIVALSCLVGLIGLSAHRKRRR